MNTNLKYYIYARKSSESEDRQVQSIPAQIDCLRELAADRGLHVVDVLVESASAKAPDQRPVFNELMSAIEEGKADGILCWHINRLSRNPKDSGNLHWMLQEEKIKCIYTPEGIYLPGDNALLFSVQAGMANQFVRDLSTVVKRGNQKKLESGGKPGVAPTGYLNKLDDHTIVRDPERFDLVRMMWTMALSGNYTRGEIYRIITDDWKYITKPMGKTGRSGGRPLAVSALYKLFTNKFYAGIIQYNGQEYPGSHEKMITLEEFDYVQELFHIPGSRRPQKHEFPFTGMIRCAICGAMYTAETKTKRLKSGKPVEYTFYHCTRRKRGVDCPKQKWVKENDLEAMINNELGKITILPIFRDLAFEILENSNEYRISHSETIISTQQNRLNQVTKEINNLTRMRYREQIDDETFDAELAKLTKEREDLTSKMSKTYVNQDQMIKTGKENFDFVATAREKFNGGDLITKRDMFRSLGQNFFIKDGKLALEMHKWLQVIEKKYPPIERKYKRLEPEIKRTGGTSSPLLEPLISDWQG